MYPDSLPPLPVTVSEEVDEILYTNVANCSVLKDLIMKAKKAETKASLLGAMRWQMRWQS